MLQTISAPAMHLPDWILFASDATLVGLAGGGLLLLALVAMLAESRRYRRKNVDKVGCMPWTAMFLACAVTGAGLLIVAVKGWLSG